MSYFELQEEIDRLIIENRWLIYLLFLLGKTSNDLMRHVAQVAIENHSEDIALLVLLENLGKPIKKVMEVFKADGLS